MPAEAVEAGALPRPSSRRLIATVVLSALLTILAAIVVFPVYLAVVGSLLKTDQLTSRPPTLFPPHPTWGSYDTAWSSGHLATYLRNSAIVALLITCGQVLTAILAGYAFAFLEFPFRRTLFIVFIATLMVPFEVTSITNVNTVVSLHWYNTYSGRAVPFPAHGMSLFLFGRAFSAIR